MPIVKVKSSFISNYFPTPKFLSFDVAGLDITHGAIRVMKLEKNNAGYVPHIYDEIILNTPCALLEQESDLYSCDELRDSLKKLKEQYKLEYVSVSVPELKTYIFKTKLPKEALKTIDQAILFKLEENVPLPPKDVVFQYSILSTDKEWASDNNINVVVSALPKSVIETYTKLLLEVGLHPVSFESESHSLARTLVRKGDNSSYILVNFGISTINLSIVERGIVQYTSSLPINSGEIVQDLNSPQAQALKEQINKLLIYWFTNKNDPDDDKKIEMAILSGEYAATPGLVDFLSKGLKLSVRLGNVWQNAFSVDKYVPPISFEKSLDYATATGLALLDK